MAVETVDGGLGPARWVIDGVLETATHSYLSAERVNRPNSKEDMRFEVERR